MSLRGDLKASPEVKELRRDLASARKEVVRLTAKGAAEAGLRGQIATLHATVEDLRGRRKFKVGKGRSGKSGDYFTRVVIPDSHGCLIDKPAAGAFLDDLEALRPREIVMLGDHLDCSGFLSAHSVLNWEREHTYTYEEDIDATNWFLDEIQKRAPGASIFYLEGNHEYRVRRWCVDKVQAGADLQRMMKALHAEHVLHLGARGIEFFSWTENHMGLKHPGTIRLGDCYFTHGLRKMPRNGAKKMLERYGANVVFGHTHKMQFWATRTVRDEALGAWCPGCLCELQPTYAETDVTEWQHGYGLQFVRKSGEFQHMNVPIIGGRSFMVPITQRGK